MKTKYITIVFISFLIIVFSNCGNGNFTLKMTDREIDEKLGKVVEQVNVTLEEINVQGKIDSTEDEDSQDNKKSEKSSSGNAWITISSEAQQVNLIELISDPALISEADLEPGEYSEIRIVVSLDNTIKFEGDDTLYDLKIPSGTSSGIKIKVDFTISSGDDTEVLLDFDAFESVEKGSGDLYNLKPVIKLKDKKEE
jgi:hypothetical protein